MNTSEYLRTEITGIEKRTRTTKIVGIVLTLIVLIYTGMAVWYTSVLTNPDNLSNFIVVRFGEEAPKVIASTEMNLINNAPAFANKLSKNVQQAIPEFRLKAQAVLSAMADKKMSEIEGASLTLADSYFEAHKGLLKPQGADESIEAYGARVADFLADQFGEELEKAIKNATGKSIDDIKANADGILSTFKTHVDILSQTELEKLSRKEQLERIIISHIINKYLSEVK